MDYVIGLDGGGTATRCAAVSLDGRLLGYSDAGGSNFRRNGLSSALANVEAAARGAVADADLDLPARFGAFCIAGAGMPDARRQMQPGIAALGLASDLLVTNDVTAALAGAHALAPGVVVIAGTGAVALARSADGGEVLVDGCGPLLGDEGSGYWIGLRALNAALAAGDGRGQPTGLTSLVLAHFGLSELRELISRLPLDQTHSADIAPLAKLCAEAAARNDLVARRILECAGERLATTARAAARSSGLDTGPVVAAMGSVLQIPWVRACFEEHLSQAMPGASVVEPVLPAVLGAALIGLEAAGVQICETIVSNLQQTAGSR